MIKVCFLVCCVYCLLEAGLQILTLQRLSKKYGKCNKETTGTVIKTAEGCTIIQYIVDGNNYQIRTKQEINNASIDILYNEENPAIGRIKTELIGSEELVKCLGYVIGSMSFAIVTLMM